MALVHNFRIKYTIYTSAFDKLEDPFYYYVDSIDEAKSMVHLLDSYNGHLHELIHSFSADLEIFDSKSQQWVLWSDKDGKSIWDLVEEDEFDEDYYFDKELKKLLTGLLWKSQVESPMYSVYLGGIDNILEQLLKHTDCASNVTTKIQEIDEFFSPITEKQDYHDQREKAELERYQTLLLFLKKYLNEIKVYCIGDTEIEVYVLGKTVTDCVAGLTTKIVKA